MLTNNYQPQPAYWMRTDPYQWEDAKKEIRQLGIRVTTSLKACSLGCCLDEHQISEDEKALWQSANRWDKYDNYNLINHSGLDYAEMFEVCKILDENDVIYRWDGMNYVLEIFF